MSFAVFQQLTRSTVVDACLICPFTSPDATNLVLIKGDQLEVYDLQKRQGRLLFAYAAPLLGRPDAFGSFRPGGPGTVAHLAVILRRSRYLAVLRHDPEFHNVLTCGQLSLAASPGADVVGAAGGSSAASGSAAGVAGGVNRGFRPQVATDPEERCIVTHIAPDRVLVFAVAADASDASLRAGAGAASAAAGAGGGAGAGSRDAGNAFHQDPEHPPGLRTPFEFSARAPLRLHQIDQVQFLPGYQQPTLACLGQKRQGWGGRLSAENSGNCSVLIVALDLEEKAAHLVWATHQLPHDVFRIVPLQPPVGGMLALAKNTVLYLKEHGTTFFQNVNPCAELASRELEKLANSGMESKDETKLGICLSGCSVAVMSPTTLLFSLMPAGRLYLAHLVLSSRDTVGDIMWTSPATVTPVWDLCTVGDEFAFLANISGGGILLKATRSKKKAPAAPVEKRPRLGDITIAENLSANSNYAEELKSLRALHESLRDTYRSLKSYSFSVADEMITLGAIQSMSPWIRPSNKAKDEDDEEDENQGADGKNKDGVDVEDEQEEQLSGTERFMCCSGNGARGALYLFQRAVPMEILTEFELPLGAQFSAVWTFRQAVQEPVVSETSQSRKRARDADENADSDLEEDIDAAVAASARSEDVAHRFVLLSGTSRSMLLETTDEIEEISKKTPLDPDAKTVCAGGLHCDRFIVQVTPEKMCFIKTSDPMSSDGPSPVCFAAPSDVAKSSRGAGGEDAADIPDTSAMPEAVAGYVCDPFVVVVFKDQSLRLFRLQHRDIKVKDITDRLPAECKGAVIRASIYRHRPADATTSRCLLVIVTPALHGTLRVIDLATMEEVFYTTHLVDVPPVIRNALPSSRAHAATLPIASTASRKPELDHLRALTDPCAPLPRNFSQQLAAANSDAAIDAKTIISAEFVDLDTQSTGPVLVVLVLGRPVLVYASFIPSACAPAAQPSNNDAATNQRAPSFPYHFALQEHDNIGLIEAPPSGAYRPLAAFKHPGGAINGAVVVPPHADVPALWLTAKRNRVRIHPLQGSRIRGFAPLHAACCEKGFFALWQGSGVGSVVAQVCTLATADGFPEGAFDLHAAVPSVRMLVKRTPRLLATRPADGAIALAVSDSVDEAADQVSGPSIDEDPLSDDWSIVRNPPVEGLQPPPMPRLRQQFELMIGDAKSLSKLGQHRFSFDPDEHVLCMEWMTLPGFPEPSLVVGTGVNTGEDLTCRGRLLIFSIKGREPGVVPAIYQRSLKWPVTVIRQWNQYLVHNEGYKLYFERWESSNFNKIAFFDANMCITALSSIKSFLLLGDLRRGLDFVQWREDSNSQNRSLRRLSRSPPSVPMSVLACDFIVCGKSLGLVALDQSGTAHLYSYSPHSDGREGDQLLRSCATFTMGSPCRTALRVQAEAGVQCMLAASGGGELVSLRPIDDVVYRTVATMLGMLSTRLPFRCGLNPRALRNREGAPALVAPRKNIEDANMLRLFAFLSLPLQSVVADKMRMPVSALMQTALPCAGCQLSALRGTPAS